MGRENEHSKTRLGIEEGNEEDIHRFIRKMCHKLRYQVLFLKKIPQDP